MKDSKLYTVLAHWYLGVTWLLTPSAMLALLSAAACFVLLVLSYLDDR